MTESQQILVTLDISHPIANLKIVGIVVLDKFRSKGIGYESIKLLESYCIKKIGINKLNATISSNNIKSLKLFKKSGFVKVNNNLYEKRI